MDTVQQYFGLGRENHAYDLRRNDKKPSIGAEPTEKRYTGQDTVLLEPTPSHGIVWVSHDSCGIVSHEPGAGFNELSRTGFLHGVDSIDVLKSRDINVKISTEWRMSKGNDSVLVDAITLPLRGLSESKGDSMYQASARRHNAKYSQSAFS